MSQGNLNSSRISTCFIEHRVCRSLDIFCRRERHPETDRTKSQDWWRIRGCRLNELLSKKSCSFVLLTSKMCLDSQDWTSCEAEARIWASKGLSWDDILPYFFLQSKVLLVMKPTLLFLCCLSKKHKLVSQQRSWSRGKLRDAKRVNERMQLNTCIFCANSFLKQETKGNCQETAAVVFIHYAYLHECQDRIWIKFRNCLAGDWVCLRVPFSAVSFSVVTWITSFTRRGLYFSWCRLI